MRRARGRVGGRQIVGPADFSPLEANLASRSFWGPQQVVGRERAQCLAYLIQADWERLGAEWEPPSLGVRLVSDHPGSIFACTPSSTLNPGLLQLLFKDLESDPEGLSCPGWFLSPGKELTGDVRN